MEFKTAPFLEVNVIQHDLSQRQEEDGVRYLSSNHSLQPHPNRMTERLVYWAKEKPNAIFLGQRDANGDWSTITYSDTLKKVKSIAQYLLDQGISKENPIAILSGNSIEHGLLALAALHIGIPYAPISPAYSTKSTDFAKLKHCLNLLTPGLIFVQDGKAFARVFEVVDKTIPVVAVHNALEGQNDFDSMQNTKTTAALEDAYVKVNSDTIAKILFTSGSTGLPKGVINTHGNITTNLQQITQTFPFIKNEEVGITLLDWLPWNHVFGGNHNFGMVLYNGGSLYIAPTVYFNVPKGFEELVNHLKKDKSLCEFFFSKLKMLFYAGASLPQHVWDGLEELAVETIGKRVLISTGLGMTEASPSCLFNTLTDSESGMVGVPVPGLEVKLVPDEDKIEARFKGKNLTPGYWRNPKATAKAFDEEGFFKTGDAMKLIDPNDLNKGMRFDGRIAEDFKLVTGTWVSVGVLKAKLIKAGNGLIQDAVITGHDRDFLGAIIFPEINYCQKLSGLPASSERREILRHPKVLSALQATLNQLGQQSTGSSTCIQKVIIADFELSIDKGEITDKGSINQRKILSNRSEVVELIYQSSLLPNMVAYQKKQVQKPKPISENQNKKIKKYVLPSNKPVIITAKEIWHW